MTPAHSIWMQVLGIMLAVQFAGCASVPVQCDHGTMWPGHEVHSCTVVVDEAF